MILNEKTKQLLEAFVTRPSSSVLLETNEHSEIYEVVSFLTSSLVSKNSKNSIHTIKPNDKNTITIEQIRELKQSLSTKVTDNEKIARIAVILNIETASVESQNAMLKLVEEPVNNTLLILHTNNKEAVLSTIFSRTQSIPVYPISPEQAYDYGKNMGYQKNEISKAYLLSHGESKLFKEALNSDSLIYDDTEQAKQFLKKPIQERLILVSQYDKKDKLESLIKNIEMIAVASMHSTSKSTYERWQNIVKEIRKIQQLQQKNVITKLLFLRLCVTL